MKVEGNFNHESKKLTEIFGITNERADQINEFARSLILEATVTKLKRSQIVVRCVEFANDPIEAVIIAGYVEDKRKEVNGIIGSLFGGNKPDKKVGMITVKDGEIESMIGDEIPDQVIDEIENLAQQLKSIKPTGNMKVDGDGNLG